jgi:hypothetical protein
LEHLDRALPLIQKSLSSDKPDEALICAVFYVMLTECAFGEFHKAHNHLKGMGSMYLRLLKTTTGEPSSLWYYMAESSAYLDTIPGLLGWPLAIPDRILPADNSWLKYLMTTPESELWIRLDFKHVDFQRKLARYKYWAAQLRERKTYGDEDEAKIVAQGRKYIRELKRWQDMNIPPVFEEPLSPEPSEPSDETDVINSRRFLFHPRLQFQSPIHAEIHLLFYTLLLFATFIMYPVPGSVTQERVDIATKHCQCMAAMGVSPGALSPEARTFGQFFVRLTFDDAYPEGDYRLVGMD